MGNQESTTAKGGGEQQDENKKTVRINTENAENDNENSSDEIIPPITKLNRITSRADPTNADPRNTRARLIRTNTKNRLMKSEKVKIHANLRGRGKTHGARERYGEVFAPVEDGGSSEQIKFDMHWDSKQNPNTEKTEHERIFLEDTLTDGDNFIFEVLSKAERNMLVDRMECVSYRKDGVIIKQGNEGDYFYVISEGDVEVYVSKARQEKLIKACLGPIASNDSFDVMLDPLDQGDDLIDMLVDEEEEEKDAVAFTPKPAGRDRRYSSLVDAFASNEDDDEEQDDDDVMEEAKKEEKPKEMPVAVLGPGDTFGELALLYNAPRMATCIASTNCTVWRLHVNDFRGIMNGVRQSEMETEQNDGSIISVFDTLKSIPMLQALDEKRFSQLADALVPVRFSREEQIVKKGEKFDMFHIIKSGEVLVHDVGTGDAQHSSANIGPGDFFGIKELLSGEVSHATHTVVSDTVVTYALSKEQFEAKLGVLEDVLKRCALRNQLKTIPIFAKSEFEPHEFETLSKEAKYVDFDALYTIATAGKATEPALYVVVSGSVQVSDEVKSTINTFKIGEHFGSETLKPAEDKKDISDQTIEVIEPTTCAVLTRETIEKAIGNISRLGKPLPPVLSKLDRTIKLDDLNQKRILGIGSFGKVWLVQHKKTNAIYALKTMDKKQILKLKLHKNVLREKNIMASVDHPFIIKLKAAFQCKHHLYMLENFIQGGELFTVIHKDDEEAGLENDAAVFYAACVLESLAHLHKRNICYRDLKPENILVDKDGYCVLIDMGFAKVVLDKTHSICGTPEYLAPELILHKGHNTSVDDWALGVLIYEMFVGQSPFFRPGSTQQAMFKRIVNGTYMFPNLAMHGIDVPYHAQDLITKLLVKNPSDRLGCFAGGASDIKNHSFFKGILNNDDLINKKITAPWIPEVNDALDASNFDDYSIEEKKKNFWYNDDLSEEQQAKFKDF